MDRFGARGELKARMDALNDLSLIVGAVQARQD